MYETPKLSKEEILVYLRKSRSDDALLTVEEVLQKHETILDEWTERNIGATVPEENKHREVVSGETIEDRPEMKELLKRIESPRIKAVLVVEVQRLSRGDLEDAGRLIKLLRYTNTLVITPQKTYDLRDDYDRDFFERELKRGNEFLEYQKKIMNRGRLLSVQQGNYLGSIAPYGYEKVEIAEDKRKCHTLAIKEDEANVVKIIFDLYVNKDFGYQRIANYLDGLGIKTRKSKRWNAATIKDLLENIHYIGKVKWNFRKTVSIVEEGEVIKTRPKAKIGEFLIYDGKHPAIIDDALFNAAQEKHGRNHRAKPTTKVRNPLAGILFCKCGKGMSYRTHKHTDGSTRCSARLMCNEQKHCNTGSATFDEVIEKVAEILEQCIHDFELRVSGEDKNAEQLHANLIKDLEKKLVALSEKEISLWDKYSEEGMPKMVFDKLNEKVLREMDEIRHALCAARDNTPSHIDYEEKLLRFKDALEALKDPEASAELKNRLLKACISRIEYTRKSPERIKRAPGEKRGETLKRGGQWTTPPIELDVKLNV